MKTKNFLETLKNNLTKDLLFEYSPDKFVGANYHITEIKTHSIESIDCGGLENSWREIVVQLWESPLEVGKRTFMKVSKAIEIVNKVNAIKPLFLDSEIKIEYGNKSFHTANLVVHSISENDKSVIVKLHPDSTQCKASDHCCTPEKSEKNKISLAPINASKEVKCC
ncbi:DUF6428 family protein [Lutibacter flavus]|uniref:Uncharacterized protein n=1 Tax=Lutibacter flavus TaxID=691689 RepID=A0A238X6Z8_9FLAO|nr:DUF6428 family protein [Lutibacter flavus]SNR54480.1 hypothetical protein SAMN04488111_1626 [Lutibacter flavus]